MSISQFYLCAIPKQYWEKAVYGVDIARFAHDALECERRIGKEVNLENEFARYTLLCQQLEREVIERGNVQPVNNAQELVLLQKNLSSSNLRHFLLESTQNKAANVDNPFKWRHFESDIILLTVRWHVSNIMHILIN